MSISIKKPNPMGLDIAYSHSSAVGNVRVEEVYNAIEAVKYQKTESGNEEAQLKAKALRSIVDRIDRLGQRYHENKNVAPADHIRMEKEFEVLSADLIKILSEQGQSHVALQGIQDLGLKDWTPQLAEKFASALFRGEIRPQDEVNSIGSLEDPDLNPLEVRLKGRLRLHQESASKPFDTIKYLNDRKTYPLQNDPPYPTEQWVHSTADSVRHFVLENATTAPKIHGHIGSQDPILKVFA